MESLIFPASARAKVLGYAVPQKAIIDHCKGFLKQNILRMVGNQQVNFIPEGHLYRLYRSQQTARSGAL